MNQNNWEVEAQNDLGYGQLLDTFWRRRFWFAGVFAGAMAIAVPLALTKEPVYQSYMQVLAESNYQAKELRNNRDEYTDGQFTDTSIEIDYTTQLKVLKSSEILKRVISKLGWSGYEGSESEIIEFLRASLTVSQLAEVDAASKNPTATKIIQTVYTGSSPTQTKQVLEAIKEVYLEYNLEQQEKRLKDGLNFINKQIPKAKRDLTKVEDALTEISQANNLISPEQEAIALKENIRNIAQERREIKAQQRQTQGNSTSLQQQLGVSAENSQALFRLSQSPRYQKLLEELEETEALLATEQTKFTDDNPIIQDLIDQRNSQQERLVQEAKLILGELPDNFANQLELLRKQERFTSGDPQFVNRLSESQTDLVGIQEREVALAETEAELKQKLAEFPAIIAQHNNLSQELTIKQEALQQLLEAKQEIEIELNRGGFDWQVIEPPQLGVQIAPNLAKDLLLGTVVASFLGVTAAFIKEAMDERITNIKGIEGQTALPVLGSTPALSSSGSSSRFLTQLPFLSNSDPSQSIQEVVQWQPFREALDVIYENLKLSNLASPLQSLAITSATAGEGKSTLTLGLALSVARHQQRVLVIDADLRCPSLHQPFDLSNQFGLADFLAGETRYPNIEQVNFLGETIDILPSGYRPQDPVKLLSSSRLSNLIDEQKHNYDLILIDTPPAIGMVDAIKIASICDSAVLMMRLDKVKTSELIEAEALLSKLNVLGIVANDSKDYETKSKYLLPQQV